MVVLSPFGANRWVDLPDLRRLFSKPRRGMCFPKQPQKRRLRQHPKKERNVTVNTRHSLLADSSPFGLCLKVAR